MIKKYDNRVLLLGSGLLMALIGGDITTAFKGYSNGLASTSIMNAIISAAGFAAVCHVTKCSEHLMKAVLKIIMIPWVKTLALPLTMIFAAVVNFTLGSANGTIASLGTIVIPVLIAAGYHPAAVAAAFHVACYSSTLSPGDTSNNVVAEIADTNVLDVIANQIRPIFVTETIYIIVMIIMIKLLKDDHYKSNYQDKNIISDKDFKVNYFYVLAVSCKMNLNS